jgi:hypothetical protein
MNRGGLIPVGRAEPLAKRSAPQPGGRGNAVNGRRRVLGYAIFPVVCFNAGYRVCPRFVGDDAGGIVLWSTRVFTA